MGVFRAGNGKICIEPKSFNYTLWMEVAKSYGTQGNFTLQTGITRRTVENFKKRRPITLETLAKLLALFPEYEARDWVFDYNEREYSDLGTYFGAFKPTKADMKDCINEILSRRRTIQQHLEFKIDHNRLVDVMGLVDRIILEAQYYGTMVEINGKTEEIVKRIRNVRNGKGELK